MFQIERQKKLLEFIQEKHTVTNTMLTHAFNVSPATIRRDIDALAEKGSIVKTHGGAVSVSNSLTIETPYTHKLIQNQHEKRAIGKKAASLILDNDVIILDAGTTTLEVARNITQHNITVVTNDIKIAVELAEKSNITVYIVGGVIRSSYTLTGNNVTAFLQKLHVNKCFLGCHAISLEFGVSNNTFDETANKIAMMEAADETILVTDSSKLHKKVFSYVCDTSAINKLIINQIDDVTLKALQEKGTEVILAE